MQGFEHTIQDIARATGLTRKYIDRCYRIMPLLERYRRQSPERNKYFYSNDALTVFHRVAELKEQGHTRRGIKLKLEESRLGSPGSGAEDGGDGRERSAESAGAAPASGAPTRQWIAALEEAHKAALEATQEVVASKEATIKEMSEKMLLLTDGRSPEEVRAARERRAERRKRRRELLDRLAALSGRWGKRSERRALIDELRRLEEDG